MIFSSIWHQQPTSSGANKNLPDVATPLSAGAAATPVGPPGGTASASALTTVTGLPAPVVEWMEARAKKAALKLEKLDTDLKNYRSNAIKESIRRGHDDLGDHYLDCGDLSNALKCYSR